MHSHHTSQPVRYQTIESSFTRRWSVGVIAQNQTI